MPLFGGEDSKNVVFTKNITESLNIIIKGLLHSGDHVLVTAMEHNAVMRPLQQIGTELTTDNAPTDAITFSRIPCDADGALRLDALPQLVRPNTKAIIMTHASNVCGTLQPLAAIGSFCQKHNLKFIVDSAQSAGVVPINMQEMHIDALAFTGHKGLLAPQGIGGFVLLESMIDEITPLIVGGTGSLSHTEHPPASCQINSKQARSTFRASPVCTLPSAGCSSRALIKSARTSLRLRSSF